MLPLAYKIGMLDNTQNCSYFFNSVFSLDTYLKVHLFLLVIFFIWYLIDAKDTRGNNLSVFLIIIGGFGNFFDRMDNGCVSDPINFFRILNFNFWDVLVTAGVFVLVYGIIKEN